MTDEVKQPTKDESDKLWDKVQQDRAASTPADEVVVEAAKPGGAVVKTDDPLGSLPEPTRKLIESLQAKTTEYDGRFQKMNQQLATAHGTIGNLKQRLDDSQIKLQTITPTIEAVAAENLVKEEAKAQAKAEKRKAARDKMADIFDADVVDELMPLVDAKPAKEVKPEIKPITEEVVDPNAPDKDTQVRLMLDLTDRVPGWRQKRDSAEFKAWLPAQSADIKAGAVSWDIDEAASVFAAFDKHKSDAAQVAKIEQERQERLRRGESIQGRGGSNGNVDTSADALWQKVQRDRAKQRAQSA